VAFWRSSVGIFKRCFLPTSIPLPNALNIPNNTGDKVPDAALTIPTFFNPVKKPASSKPSSFLYGCDCNWIIVSDAAPIIVSIAAILKAAAPNVAGIE